jgi:hypothetical protein
MEHKDSEMSTDDGVRWCLLRESWEKRKARGTSTFGECKNILGVDDVR